MWLSLLFYAALIILAGSLLTRNGERISSGLGLSSAWAGALLLPLATSLPELVTSCRASLINAPDLAGGNIYGSVLFNLTLIPIIDLVQGRGPLTSRQKRNLIFTALLSMTMISLSLLGLLLALPLRLGWIGYDTIVILIVYLLGNRMILGLEQKKMSRDSAGKNVESKEKDYSLDQFFLQQDRDNGKDHSAQIVIQERKKFYRSVALFVLAGGIIFYAGTGLTDTADLIALKTGLNRTLVGSLFIAITTSLPELVTTTTAVRLGSVEMAVANVFGANLFNILILFFADAFFLQGPLLASLAAQNMIAATMGLLLTLLAVISLVYPIKRDYFWMGLPSLIIAGGYLLTLIFLYYAN